MAKPIGPRNRHHRDEMRGVFAPAFSRRAAFACAAASIVLAWGAPGYAASDKPYAGIGNPIDDLMKYRIVPPDPDMPDFVQKTRPSEEVLDYTPLYNKDPAYQTAQPAPNNGRSSAAGKTAQRPPPPVRDQAQLDALTRKLDASAKSNAERAARDFSSAPRPAQPPITPWVPN